MTLAAPLVSIVDDDLSVRRALRRLVQSAGYTVVSFDEYASLDAIRLAKETPLSLSVRKSAPGLLGGGRVAQQVRHVWIDVCDFSTAGIDNKYPVSCGFKKPPVASFGRPQALSRSRSLSSPPRGLRLVGCWSHRSFEEPPVLQASCTTAGRRMAYATPRRE